MPSLRDRATHNVLTKLSRVLGRHDANHSRPPTGKASSDVTSPRTNLAPFAVKQGTQMADGCRMVTVLRGFAREPR